MCKCLGVICLFSIQIRPHFSNMVTVCQCFNASTMMRLRDTANTAESDTRKTFNIVIDMLTATWWINRITKTVTKQYSAIHTAVLHQTNTLNVCLHSFAESVRIKDKKHAAGIS
ncbi:hypothetical protein XENORESO_014199 [Xenotaenia resolanae]|uniref:Secreted protein n=1 Tax=Xenotaenia resolanae TaxID=208358 RepID=A0ABV0X0R3_9TELE